MSGSADVRLFSYGTLQREAVQLETFGRRLEGRADVLLGYRRALMRITDPAIVAVSGAEHHPLVTPSDDPADAVEGQVFLITPAELAAADAYEAPEYRRISVSLASGDDAWLYVEA